MKIKANENLIVVRYSNKYENECILKHQEVIKREGFVWFGKCGNVIRKVNAENILSQENPKVILYSKSGSYICELKDISYEEQTKNIPEYYKNLRNSKDECGYELFKPSMYYALSSIKKINPDLLKKFVILKSGKNLYEIINKTMTTQMIIKSVSDINIKEDSDGKTKNAK